MKKYPEQLVFGLDIGTRSIVGTVGYLEKDKFIVLAQRSKEHETRAMMDGQIHDIKKVSETIAEVKEELEEVLGVECREVCIAAAGRVLRTVTTSVEQEFLAEKEVTEEDVYALASMGVEKAYAEFMKTNDMEMKFYCVGYSVIRYYMNNYPIGNLEGHKAKVIGADMIATFLPDDVVDGLYKAVELAGLRVANLTLEPIAAIQVAIPEMYRMLNIALVDVGAGTSDISITKDGSIIAYGMIPTAGDSLTELIARHCLVDFTTAEMIKRSAGEKEIIEYNDIMGITQTISTKEVLEIVEPVIKDMTKQVADKIRELNGDKSVSAVFVVGGGGKIPTYTEFLAEELGIAAQRVAVRGEEVMQKIEFCEEDVVKDSLLVTPVGICMSFYEQSNSFIFATFNEERIKLYDNSKLAVVDAAMQAGFPNDGLFPKRGKEISYTVNGTTRLARGQLGEAAQIFVNGKEADIHTKIFANDCIQVTESTAGEAARLELRQIPEFSSELTIWVNEKQILLPAYASVNGTLQSGFYEVCDGDEVQILNYYTVGQIVEFMDVLLDPDMNIYVNNKVADKDTKVYENFTVVWTMEELRMQDAGETIIEAVSDDDYYFDEEDDTDNVDTDNVETEKAETEKTETEKSEVETEESVQPRSELTGPISILVNGRQIVMTGKKQFIFVDIFDYIDIDLSKPQGSGIVTNLNGRPAQYMEQLHGGDVIEVYWRK
ncbi:MAG: rod shape-determining protein [Lachnospiraceae bacterium]|nr:rod shape-determining protein [Lachnospiraceae bacterium]